jgi:hypothetical protein
MRTRGSIERSKKHSKRANKTTHHPRGTKCSSREISACRSAQECENTSAQQCDRLTMSTTGKCGSEIAFVKEKGDESLLAAAAHSARRQRRRSHRGEGGRKDMCVFDNQRKGSDIAPTPAARGTAATTETFFQTSELLSTQVAAKPAHAVCTLISAHLIRDGSSILCGAIPIPDAQK